MKISNGKCLLISGVAFNGANVLRIPFGVAITDRTTGVIYNVDKAVTPGVDVLLMRYTHEVGEYIFPPYAAFGEPVLGTPSGKVRIFANNGVFGYELDNRGTSSDPINNQTIFRDNLYELGTPAGWVFGDNLEWQKKF